MELHLFLLLVFLGICHAALTYKGHDISSVQLLESQGVSYSQDGKNSSLESILIKGGFNSARLRIWVNPSGGTYGLDYNVKLAKRLRAAGVGIYIDLHYSDTWADPAHQTTPSGWPLNVDALTTTLKNYTQTVMQTFKREGIPISIVSIGNEITNGFLWPTGKAPNFGNISKLLHGASEGVRNADTTAKIMIHLDDGWDWSKQEWWYSNALKEGPFKTSDFDLQGVSYYPFYNTHATLANLTTSLANLVRTYNKDIIIAETDWPFSCQGGPTLSERGIPTGAQGQLEWMQKVAQVVNQVPNGHGKGIYYWEPAWITNANLGSGCSDNVIFDTARNNPHPARASVNMYQNL